MRNAPVGPSHAFLGLGAQPLTFHSPENAARSMDAQISMAQAPCGRYAPPIVDYETMRL